MADQGMPERSQGWAGPAVALSPVYDEALNFARVLHAQQRRKSNGAPYLSHLLEVSGLVLEYGGDEQQAIAALLHDAIEDQAEAFGGAVLLGDIIGNRFGPTVLRLVQLCSDCEASPSPPGSGASSNISPAWNRPAPTTAWCRPATSCTTCAA